VPTLQESKVEARHLVLPEHTSPIETAHGSNVLRWMERTGTMSAMHFCGGDVVTAGFDSGRFHNPIPELEIETDASQRLFDEGHNADREA